MRWSPFTCAFGPSTGPLLRAHHHRIATRYEKLAVSFLAMIKLEIIRRILLGGLPGRA